MSWLTSSLSLGWLAVVSSAIFGQAPAISPGGIVNAASFASSGSAFHALAPQSLASIFGTNLATGTQSATGTPLPTSLLGTTVAVNGVLAPLVFVSPTQINFQVPNGLATASITFSRIQVIVTSPTGSSLPAAFPVDAAGPGIFTANGSGCGPGAIQNVTASGQVSLNTPANSVQPGEFLTLYGTGFLGPNVPLADGVPASASPLTTLQSFGVLFLDGVRQLASFNGLAPGLVGVDQANLQVPASTREGCAVPLTYSNYLTSTSQPVTVAVHRGGGACVDPPAAAESTILLKRVTTAGSANDGTVETLDATFPQSPGRRVTPIDPVNGYSTSGYVAAIPSPSCPIPGYVQLGAGTLSLKTASSTYGGVTASPAGTYHATLPANTLQAGPITVSTDAAGPAGAFQTTIPFGQDIQIQNPPAAGSTLHLGGTIAGSWSGGDPNSRVTVFLISHYETQMYVSYCQALASAGQCYLPTISLTSHSPVTTLGSATQDGELLYQVDPNPAAILFSAPGLSLGGQATWRIQHSFRGFAIEP